MRINHWTWVPLASVLLFSGCAGEGGSTTGETGPLCVAEADGGCSDGCEKDAVLGCVPAVDAGVSVPDSKKPPVCDGKTCEPPPCECVDGSCAAEETCTCEGVVCKPPPPPPCECVGGVCIPGTGCTCEGVTCEPPPPPPCECVGGVCVPGTGCTCEGVTCEPPPPCDCVGGICDSNSECTCEGVVCEPPPECGCTLTQGFWKNHEADWPVDGLNIGGTDYTAAELDAILETPAQGDASIILAYQLIAALLNVENGANCTEVEGLTEAQAWFAAYCTDIPCGIDSSSDIGQVAVGLGAQLDAFNMGDVGPGHCE